MLHQIIMDRKQKATVDIDPSELQSGNEDEVFIGVKTGLRITPCWRCYKASLINHQNLQLEEDYEEERNKFLIEKCGTTKPSIFKRVKVATGEDWITVKEIENARMGNCKKCLQAGPLGQPCAGCQHHEVVVFLTENRNQINPLVITKHVKKDIEPSDQLLAPPTSVPIAHLSRRHHITDAMPKGNPNHQQDMADLLDIKNNL